MNPSSVIFNANPNFRFLQVFLENPFLVDGHSFDIGIYVLITSIDPLRIYRYKRENLFRFCPEPYHPFNPNNHKKFIVQEDHISFWEMNVFKELALKFNFSQSVIFKLYLRQNGCDPEELWTKFDEAISTVMLLRVSHVIEVLNTECKIFNCTNDNFFELVRFDFMIDDQCEVSNHF